MSRRHVYSLETNVTSKSLIIGLLSVFKEKPLWAFVNSFQNLYFLIFLNHRTKVYSRWRIAWSGEWDPCTQRSHSFWQHVSPFELDVIKTVREVNHLVSCLKSLWILHTHGRLCCTVNAILDFRGKQCSVGWKISKKKFLILLAWRFQCAWLKNFCCFVEGHRSLGTLLVT